MSNPNYDMDRGIASLVEVTDALLRGEYDLTLHEPIIDTKGLLSNLAQKINSMVLNLRNVEVRLSSATEQAPTAVDRAQSVVELMSQSTSEVLNKCDKIGVLTDKLEDFLSSSKAQNPKSELIKITEDTLNSMKGATFDIIASQSYQDVARQRMETLIKDLTLIRDLLIETVLVLNIGKDKSQENIEKTAELIREVREVPPAAEGMKQDLVDDLLAEFGF